MGIWHTDVKQDVTGHTENMHAEVFEHILNACNNRSSSSMKLVSVLEHEEKNLVSLQIHYLMILGANWAYLKSAASTHDYQDIKTKDDQDLEAEARSKEGQNSSSYS